MQGQKFSMRKLIPKRVKQPMDQRFDIEIPTNYTVKSPLEAWHLASIIFFASFTVASNRELLIRPPRPPWEPLGNDLMRTGIY